MDLNPIIRLCLQTTDGYYSLPWDATAGIIIMPGSGVGVVTHAGKTYAFSAADPSAAAGPISPTLIADLTAMLTTPAVMAQPGDDLGALLAAGGVVEVEPGTYGGFTAPKS